MNSDFWGPVAPKEDIMGVDEAMSCLDGVVNTTQRLLC